jgi:hypothetical protein
MANNRIAIRAAVSTLLTGATSAGTNVFTDRKSKLWESELPAILIYTFVEATTPESINLRRYIRDLELKIDVKVEATTSVDDILDALIAEIETIIIANPGLSGTVLSTIHTHTEIVVDSGAETDIARATLTYQCKYIS